MKFNSKAPQQVGRELNDNPKGTLQKGQFSSLDSELGNEVQVGNEMNLDLLNNKKSVQQICQHIVKDKQTENIELDECEETNKLNNQYRIVLNPEEEDSNASKSDGSQTIG